MRKMCRPEKSLRERADDVFQVCYYDQVGHLNREQRRTTEGRARVAEAEAAALRAKVAYLEKELERFEG